jgi:hypothetical protein
MSHEPILKLRNILLIVLLGQCASIAVGLGLGFDSLVRTISVSTCVILAVLAITLCIEARAPVRGNKPRRTFDEAVQPVPRTTSIQSIAPIAPVQPIRPIDLGVITAIASGNAQVKTLVSMNAGGIVTMRATVASEGGSACANSRVKIGDELWCSLSVNDRAFELHKKGAEILVLQDDGVDVDPTTKAGLAILKELGA